MTQEKFEKAQELNSQREAASEFGSVMRCLVISGIYTNDGDTHIAVDRCLVVKDSHAEDITRFNISNAFPLELYRRIEKCISAYIDEIDDEFDKL